MKPFVIIVMIIFPFVAMGATVLSLSSGNTVERLIEIRGDIEVGDAAALGTQIGDMPKGTLVLRLNSAGGSVNEGRVMIARLLTLRKKGIKLITQVRNGDQCGSMCLPIFMTGEERRAGEVAAFYFHGVLPSRFCLVVDESETRKYVNLLLSLGMSPRFKERLERDGIFSKADKFWLSGREIYDESFGFVTTLEDRYQKTSELCMDRWSSRPR